MIQLDGAAELQAILDGVFKPPRREERRQRQRFERRGTVHHHPLLTMNYPGAGENPHRNGNTPDAQADQPSHHARAATTEDLINSGYAEGRVINPPPPCSADTAAGGSVVKSYLQDRFPPIGRIWSEGA